MKIHLISLGCDKNTINSEQMLYLLTEAGYETTADIAEADFTIINTCGFIEDAKKESIEQILEATEFNGKIIVAGCLAEREKENILREMPEVSAVCGVGEFDNIVNIVRRLEDNETGFVCAGNINAAISETPRAIADGRSSAYIKIAEGCNNRCSYCAIPAIRGNYRSRPMENIIAEAKQLCESGVRELIIIAQDTTRYTYGKQTLSDLLKRLCEIPELKWIRLHYLYPEGITDELIQTIKTQEKILKYADIPIQHISDKILTAMNRRGDSQTIKELFTKLKREIPEIVLRTSIIAGFPGETDEDFSELCDFLETEELPRVGFFSYSQEDGTPAANFADQIDDITKYKRIEILQSIQADIMDKFNIERLGSVVEVLCEGYDKPIYYGRSFAETPETDGLIFFYSQRPINIGDFVRVKLTETLDGDVLGEVLDTRGGLL